MKLGRKNILGVLATTCLLLGALFVALPPRGICLRELLGQAQCCLVTANALPTPVGRACCAAHAVAAGSNQQIPLAPTEDGVCFATASEPYLAPSSNGEIDTQVFTVEPLLPLDDIHIALAVTVQQAALLAALGDSPPMPLRRGSSILRI